MGRTARPDLIYKAICAGHIQWKESAVRNMLQSERTKRFTSIGVNRWLRGYALATGSGCVCARPETRDYWLEVNPDDPWWYKVNIEFEERPARLFVEMKLVDPDDEDYPWAEVVNCHF